MPDPQLPANSGLGGIVVAALHLRDTRIDPASIANIENALNRLAPIAVSISCRRVPCEGHPPKPPRGGAPERPHGCLAMTTGPTVSDGGRMYIELFVKVNLLLTTVNLKCAIELSYDPELLLDEQRHVRTCPRLCRDEVVSGVKVRVPMRGSLTLEPGIDATGAAAAAAPLGIAPDGDSSAAVGTPAGAIEPTTYDDLNLQAVGPDGTGAPAAAGLLSLTVSVDHTYTYRVAPLTCP